MKRKFLLGLTILLILVLITVVFHDIETDLTVEDKNTFSSILDSINLLPQTTFEEEITKIIAVQSKILSLSPPLSGNGEGIAHNQSREPKQFFMAKNTVCYDRSRVIEKALKYSGFEVRHAAIYSSRKSKPTIRDLFSSSSPSHSTTEVLTSKGWMIVDSNHSWLGLSLDDNPYSIVSLSEKIPKWKMPYPSDFYSNYYGKPVKVIYGLYSRHGKFYPPYNFIPDYDIQELGFNFFE